MIIAGAGIIGLSCAWRLSLCKIPVTIFDAGTAGSEASWAGAGMLAPGGEMEEASLLTEMALRSLALYPEYVEELRAASGFDIDYRRCGALEISLTEAEAHDLTRRAARQAALGIRSEIGAFPGSVSTRFFPDDALVNPRNILAALRAVCVRQGVRLHEHERVLQILGGGVGVQTTQARYEDDGVLICAGAWSSELAPVSSPRSTPVRGHLISYLAKTGTLQTILRHQNTYLLQRQNGSLVAGASTEHVGFDRALDESTVQTIHNRASRLLPWLAAIEPSERWLGFRPGIAGGIPAIGRVDGTNIWTAYGHYRNGILLAPDTAQRIVASVTSAR